jgi:predicted dehydrogenase/dTDP-4-amino-4,6-dideoxygalactose transaminase
MHYRYGSDSRPEQLRLIEGVLERNAVGRIHGELVGTFEDGVAAYTGSSHALAVASGTIAIERALAAVGVAREHEVVVPEFAWVSVGGAVAALGAKVVVAPSGSGLAPTWDDIRPLLTSATGAVVVAHMRGVPALDIAVIAAELRARGIPLVEDCSQAWGVRLDGRHVGTWGQAATFSTQDYKLLATGEGGFVLTDDDDVALAVGRACGNPMDPVDLAQWAGNARMTELQAAIGIPQLAGLEDLVGRLRALQVEMVGLLGTLPEVERVVPDERGLTARDGRSNGTWAGLWASDAASAVHVAERLWAARVPATIGGAPDDRHWSTGWPVRVAESRLDPSRWIEVPVPDTTPGEREVLLERLAAATGSERRTGVAPRTSRPAAPAVPVAIVGCGVVSRYYGRTLASADIRVVACADSDADRAAERASQFGAAVQTVEEVAANDEIELVLNLTPPQQHAPLTRMFLEAGKGVYSEKPLALSASDAAALVELAAKHGLPLACAPETVFDARWNPLVRLLHEGLIGEPTGASVDMVGNPAAWHPRPETFYGPGGGPLWDLGPYGLTALMLLFGPISVVTGRARSGPSRQSEVPTDVRVLLEFPSGVNATMALSYDRPAPFGPPLAVAGATGVARFTGSGVWEDDGELQVCPMEGEPWTTIPVEPNAIRGRGQGVIDLVDAMADNRRPRVDAESALHVVEVIEAIERSCAVGETVAVDLQRATTVARALR